MKGWRFESHRHMLASKGIKTRYLARTSAQINADLISVKAREHPLHVSVGDWLRTRADEAKYQQELAEAEGTQLFPNTHGLISEYRQKWREDDSKKANADFKAVDRAISQPEVFKGDVKPDVKKPEKPGAYDEYLAEEEAREHESEAEFERGSKAADETRKAEFKEHPFKWVGSGK